MKSISKLIIYKVHIAYRRLRIKTWYKKIESFLFLIYHYNLRSQKKIFYCLTPPPELRNIGDHAQTVAIRLWLKTYFSEFRVIEIDKNRISSFISAINKILSSKDLFFIHSGGNLSDKALWSEEGRRKIISSFPNNKIYVLPQTIHFSNTEFGQAEKRKSIEIYSTHPNLLITGRDSVSESLAKEFFNKANIAICPDFVLYYFQYLKKNNTKPEKDILFCFRNDIEAALTIDQRNQMKNQFTGNIDEFDTTIKSFIYKKDEERFLKQTINDFSKYKVIVTDRYHGLIFSVLAERPCVVLKTIDHKLTAAYKSWFKYNSMVQVCENISDSTAIIANMLNRSEMDYPKLDWVKEYFEPYAEEIKANL